MIYSVSKKKWTISVTIQYRIIIVSLIGWALAPTRFDVIMAVVQQKVIEHESLKCTNPHVITVAPIFQQVSASSLEPGQLIWMDNGIKVWL